VNKPESPQGDKSASRRTAAQPRYQQAADELRAGIAAGSFGPDGQLPTESALCERYDVSRFTVREALRRLQTEGLIRRRRGSGTTVDAGNTAQRLPISNIGGLMDYAAGSSFHFQVIGAVTMGAVQAADLGLEADSQWIHLAGKRRQQAHGPAMALTDVYINADLAPHVDGLRQGNQSLFTQLAAAAGFRIARVDQDLRAMAAGSREAIALGIPRRVPVLRIVRIYSDSDDRVVEASVSIHPGDRFTYSMQIDQG
jgi:DNA-binding GntR family transcriptional regulator